MEKLDGVAVIGPVTVDCIFSGFPGFPAPGEEVLAQKFELQLGGGSPVIPVVLNRLGVPAKLGTFLGSDTLSMMAERLLQELHFTRVENLYQGEGRPVVISSVFSFPADRCFLSYNENATEKDLSSRAIYDFLKGSRICFAPMNAEAAKKLKEDGTQLVFDVNWQDDLSLQKYRELLGLVDYFTPNDKEALKMTGCGSVDEALRELAKATTHPIIKLGREGCRTIRDGEIIQVDAVRSFSPVDTTGAGDNFISGLVYGLYHQWDLIRCMRMANILGGYSTQQLGCFEAALTEEQALGYLNYYNTVETEGCL